MSHLAAGQRGRTVPFNGNRFQDATGQVILGRLEGSRDVLGQLHGNVHIGIMARRACLVPLFSGLLSQPHQH